MNFSVSTSFKTHVLTEKDLVRELVHTYWDDYLETLFWSSSDVLDGEGIQIDTYMAENDAAVHFSVLRAAHKSLVDFFSLVLKNYPALLDALTNPEVYDISAYFGHDLCLTQNGHGSGFWDGDYADDCDGIDIGTALTECAEKIGRISPYVGDDGSIYC